MYVQRTHPLLQANLNTWWWLWTTLLLWMSTMLLRNSVLVLVFLPSLLVSKFLAEDHRQKREAALRDPQWRQVWVQTADSVRIDMMLWERPPQEAKAKYLVWCPANAVCYEDIMQDLVNHQAKELRCNLVVFNYRGVGRSGSTWPKRGSDLSSDLRAVMRHVTKLTPSENILIYGHSLGGAIGANIRAEHPRGPFVSDRSFSSLSAAAAHHAAGIQGYLLASVFGLCIGSLLFLTNALMPSPLHSVWAPLQWGFRLSLAGQLLKLAQLARKPWLAAIGVSVLILMELAVASLPFATFRHLHIFAHYLGLGQCMGVLSWGGGVFHRAAPWLVWVLGWNMSHTAPWQKISGPKLVLYHRKDSIIPYACSLHASLPPKHQTGLSVELTMYVLEEQINPASAGQFYHNYDLILAKQPSQWPLVRARIMSLLDPPNVIS
eukprot:NODE_1556_length_1460_cov_17.136534_g1475_i0.p1 GENE.NODE_1556_length_1460_cov_17.136534_g1475_i0~~NODE_1556_length_1460_cov_17.136534_g1475_i0.p1  ORF type:complete len:434 (-),score=95.79 NODE_1556_length_1460_cov_17.136534_g1475_i0:76-1377(-)